MCRKHLRKAELWRRAFPSGAWERGSSGFTLFELVLVLGVLVVIVSLTWPAMSSYMREQEILEGAEAARSSAASTRIKAIDTGLTYQFRYEPSGRRFVVVPFDPPETLAASSTPTEGGVGTYPVLSGQLGERCKFVAPDDQLTVAEGLPPEAFANLPDVNELAATAWGPPLLFYPDGTADDAKFTIVNDTYLGIDLSIRGLTGTLTVSPLRQEGGP